MGFDTTKKEREEIYKQKKSDRLLNFIIGVTAVSLFFIVTTNLKGSFADLLFSTPSYQAKHYPFLLISEIILLLGALLWWKGNDVQFPLISFRRKKKYIIYPVIIKRPLFRMLRRQLKKIFLINEMTSFLDYEGKTNKLKDFFYKAPVQNDGLDRAYNIAFKEYKPKDFFKDDYKAVIQLFRGKNFDEKEKKFNDLTAVIEGVFKEYSKGLSHLDINKKDLKSPFRVKNILDSAVFDRSQGEIHFSAKQMIDVFDDFCKSFETFLDNYTKYKTRINKLYSAELNKKTVRKKIMIYFKLVMFRKLLKLYMNIPSGWMVIRLEDYEARAVMSCIDREILVSIDSRNTGKLKGFPDDRFVRMFLLIYHYFFTKSAYSQKFSNIFEILTPDKTAKEMEDFILKNKDILESQISDTDLSEKDKNANSN